MKLLSTLIFALLCALSIPVAHAEPASAAAIPVTVENFRRAESHKYFASRAEAAGFGKLFHLRGPMPLDHQTVIRGNRDTLYSAGVFDLDAGPLTITLPDHGSRYMSMMTINEDEYCSMLTYDTHPVTYTREAVGTRYVMIGVRTFYDPRDPKDVEEGHRLQDLIKIEQPGGPGTFEVPTWDVKSRDKLRAALLILGATVPDSRRMFGSPEQIEPIKHLIGSAMAWGGNNEQDALYLNRYPAANDGKTIYRLVLKDVPVDAFWSISIYNAQGYYQKNTQDVYSLNSLIAKKEADGSVIIQFGGRPGSAPNILPTMPGWNYMVRLYRPRAEILDGSWKFPDAQPVKK